jgi:hypothetical protein
LGLIRCWQQQYGFLLPKIAQAKAHYNAWIRGTLSVPVGKKFKIDNEFPAQEGKTDLTMQIYLIKTLMFTLRNLVHYQHNSAMKFFAFAICLFFPITKSYREQADENATPNIEIRFSAVVELQHEILK